MTFTKTLYVVRCWFCGAEEAYDPEYGGKQLCPRCRATDLSHGWTRMDGKWAGIKALHS